MYLRQMTYKYIIREETVVSMTPECRFPLKQNLGFLYIGTAVSTLRNYGVKPPGILTVLITLGKQGVHLFENGTHALVSSKQATVVDTIGAGDSHIGSVIAMRTMGHSFLEAISTANRIAAKVVSVKGPIITTEEFENAKQDET